MPSWVMGWSDWGNLGSVLDRHVPGRDRMEDARIDEALDEIWELALLRELLRELTYLGLGRDLPGHEKP